jgi:hypothetical protein
MSQAFAVQALEHTLCAKPGSAIVEDLLAREADLVAEISRLDALKRELKQVRKMLRAAGPQVVRSAKVIPIAKGAG